MGAICYHLHASGLGGGGEGRKRGAAAGSQGVILLSTLPAWTGVSPPCGRAAGGGRLNLQMPAGRSWLVVDG